MTSRAGRARDGRPTSNAAIDPVVAEFLDYLAHELARQYLAAIQTAASESSSSGEPTQ